MIAVPTFDQSMTDPVNRISLNRLTADDVPLLARWLLDPMVKHWLQLSEDPPQFCTIESVRERYERMQSDPNIEAWRIDAEDGRPIGQVELVDIHRLQRRAEMHVCIGEETHQGKGYGEAALRALLRHAFADLGLRRVFCTPDADNARAIRCFEKAGFVREGLLREHRTRYGKPIDMLIMGALAT